MIIRLPRFTRSDGSGDGFWNLSSIVLFLIQYHTEDMGKREKARLVQSYKKYCTAKNKKSVLDFFRDFMPEIIFRTTKLEGESITRKKISALFR